MTDQTRDQSDFDFDRDLERAANSRHPGGQAHLKIVNERDEVLIDADVNRVMIDTMVRYQTWESGQKDMRDQHEISLRDLKLVELTPCSDRLKRA